MPISSANNLLSRTLFPRVGLPFLCLGLMTCGGKEPVGPTGAINISPNTISFTTAPGGALDPKTVGVTPATVGLSGLTATSAYTGTPPSPWLEATLGSSEATLESPAILTLQVTNSSLPAGTYRATVTVESPAAGNAPKVNVTLTIEAAAALALVTQPSATAASGVALAEPPVVQLQTSDGEPVGQAGVQVSVALEGDGSLAGPATSTTDAQGRATFGGLAVTALVGERSLLFSAPGLSEVRSNPIAITVGAAARIAASSVTPQSAEAGTPVNETPVALVTDEAGNPVEGVSVTFAVTQGGGGIDPNAAVTTGADGLASSTSWTLGAVAGPNAATATAAGLDGSPVEFAATGTNGGVVPGPVSGATSTVAASPASFAAGSSGTTVTVTARDADNNLIGGATIVLASTGSDFVFESTTLTTGTNGPALGRATTTYTSTKAEAKSISAQITAGDVTVTPTAAAITVVAGAPAAAASTVAASPGVVIGLANTSTITITVKDNNGNPISGRPVTLDLVSGPAGVVLTQPVSPTGPTGVTTGKVGSTTGGGPYVVQATVGGSQGVAITQTASVAVLLSYAGDIEPLFGQSFINAGSGGGFTSPCSGCHVPYSNGVNAQPDLSFDQITNVYKTKPVVAPGDPNGSFLIQGLEHAAGLLASELMPSSSQQLPADVIAKIRQWIIQNGVSQPLQP